MSTVSDVFLAMDLTKMLPLCHNLLMLMKLGFLVRAYREGLGYNQTTFAKVIGISRQQLSDIERDKARLTFRVLEKLREVEPTLLQQSINKEVINE